ncbi:MAG: ATP-binding protein [bacterium]
MPHERAFPAAQAEITAPTAIQDHAFIAGRHSGASLPQLWFFSELLDLEAQAEGRPNLTSFIDAIEDLLGQGQRVRIKRGRVTIERPRLGDVIEPHRLPSGELQILTLFGELLRHLRPGAIVLIDELEISLHPALQRAVIHKLRALARKHDLQIILTTHSMEVVSSVTPQEVVLLDNILMQEGIEPGAKAG